jgi:ABC-type sulfate transport system permease component
MIKVGLSNLKSTALGIGVVMMTSPVWAQVTSSNQGSSLVNNKLNLFLAIVTGVAGILFTYCFTAAGYKFATVENTKFHDVRGLIIGGILAAGAGTFAYMMISG